MTYTKIAEDGTKAMEEANKTQLYVPNLIFVG